MEFGESVVACARREVLEETGLQLESAELLLVSNVLAYEGKHYVDLGLLGKLAAGASEEPQLLEPDKCEEWRWFPTDALPEPLFVSIPNFIRSLRSGKPQLYDTAE